MKRYVIFSSCETICGINSKEQLVKELNTAENSEQQLEETCTLLKQKGAEVEGFQNNEQLLRSQLSQLQDDKLSLKGSVSELTQTITSLKVMYHFFCSV